MKKLILTMSVTAVLAACSSTQPPRVTNVEPPMQTQPVPVPVPYPVTGIAPVRNPYNAESPIKDPVQNEVTKGRGQIPDFEVRAMNRAEVIQATQQCQDANMKPFIEYSTQRTEYGRVLVPINVHCNTVRVQ